jgi:hypothetical protein
MADDLQDPEGTEGTEQGQESQDNSLLQEMLKDVPEEHRAIVEQYATPWNSSANKKFQQIHETYKDYENLGELSELQQARRVYDMLQDDPAGIYDIIVDEFLKNPDGVKYLQKTLGRLPQDSPAQGSELPAEFQGLPEGFVKKYQQQEALLTQLAQTLLSQNEMTERQRQDYELDMYLDQMHQAHGNFDDEYFMLQLHKGHSEPDAIKAALKFVESEAPKRETPPVLTGGGIIPTGSQKIAEMKDADMDNLVATILNQSLKDQA